MAKHGNGILLLFARTETTTWFPWVWDYADAVLFLKGRLHFHRPDGTRPKGAAGGPSALVGYGARNVASLAASGLEGKIVPVRLCGFCTKRQAFAPE